MLGNLITWLIETVSHLGYPGIVLLMAIESSILPLPSELIMPPAGYLAAKGRMDPLIAVAAGTLGSILGALVNYYLAVLIGEPVLRRFGKYVLISSRSLDRTDENYIKHGEISTFVGRLLPVIGPDAAAQVHVLHRARGRDLVRGPDLHRLVRGNP